MQDFQPDVLAIRTAVLSLLNEGKEVVVVLHSYAGMPGGQALEGLGAKERKESGEKGGVKRIVYVMAYLVPEGFSVGKQGDETISGVRTVDKEVCLLFLLIGSLYGQTRELRSVRYRMKLSSLSPKMLLASCITIFHRRTQHIMPHCCARNPELCFGAGAERLMLRGGIFQQRTLSVRMTRHFCQHMRKS